VPRVYTADVTSVSGRRDFGLPSLISWPKVRSVERTHSVLRCAEQMRFAEVCQRSFPGPMEHSVPRGALGVLQQLRVASRKLREVLGVVVLLPEQAQDHVADVVQDLVDSLRYVPIRACDRCVS
jgi:hypothetical protein